MGSSNIQVYIHFVWYTKHRKPILRDELELFVHRRIRAITEDQGLEPLAINSAWNHTHLLTRWNATTEIGKAVGQWKGCTSREWDRDFDAPTSLNWQAGYGAFSIRPNEVPMLMRYIGRQKYHHRHHTDVAKFERINRFEDRCWLDTPEVNHQ